MSALRRVAARVAAGLLLGVAGCGEPPGGLGPVRVGDPAPEYAARTLDGEPVALAELEGRLVLLNVWATWCAPCRDEIPALESLHRSYAARGLEVVGVSIDQGGQEQGIRAFLREFGATYPIWLDPSGGVQSTFSTVGVPSTFLIDPEGTVLWKHVGPVRENDPALLALIHEALPTES